MPRFRNFIVNTADIKDGAVTTAKIANLAVTTAKIANLAVGTAQIANLAVTTAQIANLAVTDAKIASLSVSKLTAGTISAQTITLGTGGLIQLSTGEIRSNTGTTYMSMGGGFAGGVQFFVSSSLKGSLAGSSGGVTLSASNTLSLAGGSGFASSEAFLEINQIRLRFGGLSGNDRFLIDQAGKVTLTPNLADGQVVLGLNIERAWEFRQSATGASTSLRLASTSNKVLEIWSDSSAGGLDIVPSANRVRRSGASGPYADFNASNITIGVNSSHEALVDSSTSQFRVILGGATQMTLGTTGFIVPNVYSATTAGGSTVRVLTSGQLVRLVSSARYKKDIKPWDRRRHRVLDLTPVTFRSAQKLDDGRRRWLGLTAEDVAAVFPPAAILDERGRPDSIDWNPIVAALIAEVAALAARAD